MIAVDSLDGFLLELDQSDRDWYNPSFDDGYNEPPLSPVPPPPKSDVSWSNGKVRVRPGFRHPWLKRKYIRSESNVTQTI